MSKSRWFFFFLCFVAALVLFCYAQMSQRAPALEDLQPVAPSHIAIEAYGEISNQLEPLLK